MPTAKPKERMYADGYPTGLEELRRQIVTVEPDIVIGLYALLRAVDMTISYGEAEVLSGQATQFVYRSDQPACMHISFVPPVDTLFKALGVTWKEVTPSDAATAYGILREWIASGSLALARFNEPVLVYGYARSELDGHILGARITSRLAEGVWSQAECERELWRYPIDEANLLIRVERAPKKIPDFTELVKVAARRAVHAWHDTVLAGCATGEQAYRDLARDLRDEHADFTHPRLLAWAGRGLWKQWTARIHVERFFDRTAPRFGGKQRTAVSHAAFCYGQCVSAWMKWAGMLGPTWNAGATGFQPPFPELFMAQWRDMHRRTRAAAFVDQAREWEEKAIWELVKVL